MIVRWLRRLRAPEVVVYTRERCGLCRRAESIVAREARGATIRTVDVDSSEALVTAYGVRVPVITVDGAEVAELEVSRGSVRRAVRTARRRPVLGSSGPGP